MHSNRWVGGLVLLYGLCGASSSCAQTSATDSRFSAASERAEREGNKVFKWIQLHGAKPKPEEKATPKASADTPTRAAKPATRRKDAATAELAKDQERPSVDAKSSAEPAEALAAPLARPVDTALVPPPAAAPITATVAEPPASAPGQPHLQLASEPARLAEPEDEEGSR